jgi:SAM-dependent methyltransferase
VFFFVGWGGGRGGGRRPPPPPPPPQTIPLSALGYAVTAIDLDATLLAELRAHVDAAAPPVRVVRDDILNLRAHVAVDDARPELVVGMTDTLVHLPSRGAVSELLRAVHGVLTPGGRFITTFRDMSRPLADLDRFIPVRSDENTVFTCFLEYEDPSGETVKVHDIVYRRDAPGGEWRLQKSFFRKLRLSTIWVVQALRDAGFGGVTHDADLTGFVTVIGVKG